MIAVNVLVLFALFFSLLGNAIQFVLYYEVRAGLDDTINRLVRAMNEVSDREAAIKRLHIMYQRELYNQRKLFAKYYGEKKSEGDG